MNKIPARKLIDFLRKHLGVRSNDALATRLGCDRAVISRLVNGKQQVGAHFILRVYDKAGLAIEEIRDLLK